MSSNNQNHRNIVKPSEYERTKDMIANYRAYLDMYERTNEQGLRNHEEVERMEHLLQERIRAGEEAKRALDMLRHSATALRLTDGLSTVPTATIPTAAVPTATVVPPVLPTAISPAEGSAYIEELPHQDQNHKSSHPGSSSSYSTIQTTASQAHGNAFQPVHNPAQARSAGYNSTIHFMPQYNPQMQRNGTSHRPPASAHQPWPVPGSAQRVQLHQVNQQGRQIYSGTFPTQQSYPQGVPRTVHQQAHPPVQTAHTAQEANTSYNSTFNPSYYRSIYQKQQPNVQQPSFSYPQAGQYNQAQNGVQVLNQQQQVHRSAQSLGQQQATIRQDSATPNLLRQTTVATDSTSESHSSSASKGKGLQQAVNVDNVDVSKVRTPSSLDGALGPIPAPALEATSSTAVNSAPPPSSAGDPPLPLKPLTIPVQIAIGPVSSNPSLLSTQTPTSASSQVLSNSAAQTNGVASQLTPNAPHVSTASILTPSARTPGQADRKHLARDLLRALKRPFSGSSPSEPEAKRQAMETTVKPTVPLASTVRLPTMLPAQIPPPNLSTSVLPETKSPSADTSHSVPMIQTITNVALSTPTPRLQTVDLASNTPLTSAPPQVPNFQPTPGPPLQPYVPFGVASEPPVTYKPLLMRRPLNPEITNSNLVKASSGHSITGVLPTSEPSHLASVSGIDTSVTKALSTDVYKATVVPDIPGPSSHPISPNKIPLFLPSPSSSPGLETDTNLTDDMTELVVTDNTPSRMVFSHVQIPPAPASIQKWKKRQTFHMERTPPESEMYSEIPPSPSISTALSEALEESSRPATRFANFDEDERETIRDHGIRLRKSPCRWQGCEAVLNRPGALLKHLEIEHDNSGTISTESPWTCQWTGCGYTVISNDEYQQHIEKHALFPLRCPFRDCDENFRTPRQLTKHQQNDHKNDSVLRPSGSPILMSDYSIKSIPRISEKFPSYMAEYRAIRPASIPAARHQLVMPMVLRQISGNVPAQLQRYNAARPMPETPSRLILPPTKTPYSFIENRSTRYSSCLSTPAKIRNVTDLNSTNVTTMVENGLVLWPNAINQEALPEEEVETRHETSVEDGEDDGNDRDVFGPVLSNAIKGEDVDRAVGEHMSDVTRIRRDADQSGDEQNVELMLAPITTL